ncbi:RagB/SusD family nutrient uptake outer membrane protein [Chitinophaga sp. Cy-1792]|uniref:RagB/SusD family nutrient uptake outer membrane protein n=1 Tax=Chitinophaga sp. Cy-1792 TaxID=2608339 RepID=UPI00141DD65E|nr:RagB/SusD family nutrient uptake outer membrane protein [Chitinophaga sp. Cy-1792]NIG53019.1 RagB/SusD family nutrient uptake outer membrane protein [Chitinophaga sp. Cy-1792]
MKKLKYSGIALLLATGMFVACKKSFLERPPYGALTEEIIANKDGVNYLLVGAYGALDGQAPGNNALGGTGSGWMASPTNWVYGSVAGGDAHKGSESTDQPDINAIATGQESATNTFINAKWKAVYEGVTRCNNTLKFMSRATDMTADEKKEVEAEARFLRGHYYFELKKMFNNVPWISDTTTDVLQPNTVDIWPNIVADFTFAMNNLPATQSDLGRANKWAAQIYLAKCYLYQKQYSTALPLFQSAITNGQTSNGKPYALEAKFENNFDAAAKNGPESVFAIQMTANDGTGTITNANAGDMLNYPYNSPFGCCGFFQPTQDLVNSYRTDGTGLPYLDAYNSYPVKSDMGISSDSAYVPDTGNLDPRLDWTVGRRGLPYHDWGIFPGMKWVRQQNTGGPYAGKKMIYWQFNQNLYHDANSWAPGSAINVVLIRFSDVLLMTAECAAQTGDLGTALKYVNQVRHRMIDHPENWLHKYADNTKPMAGWSNQLAANYVINEYPAFANQAYALKAIKFERKLELATEGHRYFDIGRWDDGATLMKAFYDYESTITGDLKNAEYKKGRNEYFPVPQRQIDLSQKAGKPTLSQNGGY